MLRPEVYDSYSIEVSIAMQRLVCRKFESSVDGGGGGATSERGIFSPLRCFSLWHYGTVRPWVGERDQSGGSTSEQSGEFSPSLPHTALALSQSAESMRPVSRSETQPIAAMVAAEAFDSSFSQRRLTVLSSFFLFLMQMQLANAPDP